MFSTLIAKLFRPAFYDSFVRSKSLFENQRYRYIRRMEQYYGQLFQTPIDDVERILRPSPFLEMGYQPFRAEFEGAFEYGLHYQLAKYSGIVEFFEPRVTWFEERLKLRPGKKIFESIVCGSTTDRDLASKRFPEASTLTLGPLVAYVGADTAYSARESIKARWKKVMTYFPDGQLSEDPQRVRRFAEWHRADTVLVFIGNDSEALAKASMYRQWGFTPVTAGSQHDLYFLNRLRLILELSNVAVTTSFTPFAKELQYLRVPLFLFESNTSSEGVPFPPLEVDAVISPDGVREFLCLAELRHHKKYGQYLRGQ